MINAGRWGKTSCSKIEQNVSLICIHVNWPLLLKKTHWILGYN